MKNTLASLLLLLLATACHENSSLRGNAKVIPGYNFFENSRRIDAEIEQHRGLARFAGCTGFFLKNAQDKNYVATARHCFNYNAPRWCEGGTARDASTGDVLKCKSVVVGDDKHDLVILEFADSTRDRSLDFELASFDLSKDLRLEMLGFPGDRFNPGRVLKFTQNCWVINPKSDNIYTDIPEVASDKTFTHNCSTYGGNSGGPMFIEGTRVAIGLPDTYEPDDFRQLPRNEKSAQGVLASGFVADFTTAISELQIAIRHVPPTLQAANYPREGSFVSPNGCQVSVERISYNTSIEPITMTITADADCTASAHVYTGLELNCDDELFCQDEDESLQIQWAADGLSFLRNEETYSRQ